MSATAESARRHRRRHRHARVPVYTGPFGRAQAERLLWRAGFGPRAGDERRLARLGLDGAVHELLHPGTETLVGSAPTDAGGNPIAPYDAAGHDGLWWLDRMVRSNRQLEERMTLNWHDWFATSQSAVASQRLMLDQNETLRRNALGTFTRLLIEVTRDPAMLIWLSGNSNARQAPNENYARELMELFTLGAGRGYTERDVREHGRALTGFRNDYARGRGAFNFRFDPARHDDGVKRIFHRRGRFDWRDSCRLCISHREHPSFFVSKLWSYFVPTPPEARTRRALERLYVSGNHHVARVVAAILRHPDLYEGPRMVKPPIVFGAGMLRRLGRGIETDLWTYVSGLCGQKLFFPPDVGGWDETRWLDTATWRGRWGAAGTALLGLELSPAAPYDPPDEDAAAALRRAERFWGSPRLSRRTRSALFAFAQRCEAASQQPAKRARMLPVRQNALRMLIATSPDLQTA
jgi:Protein of unknown function (DUF1800)